MESSILVAPQFFPPLVELWISKFRNFLPFFRDIRVKTCINLDIYGEEEEEGGERERKGMTYFQPIRN